MPRLLADPTVDLRRGDRVQRATTDFPVLHLEPEIPTGTWDVVVDGLVAEPLTWSMEAVHAMVPERRTWDLHCVWGWTRLGCSWEGIPAGRLINAAHPLPEGRFVMATAVGGLYASCFALSRARRSLLAWAVDGAELTAEHGGPLRFVPPPTKWAYKGVKWVSRLTVVDSFTPGFWEAKVGDPVGDIPRDVLHHIEAVSWDGH